MDANKNCMSKSQAVHVLMDMMTTAKSAEEVEALALACRNMVKRMKDQKIGKARRTAIAECEVAQ